VMGPRMEVGLEALFQVPLWGGRSMYFVEHLPDAQASDASNVCDRNITGAFLNLYSHH
jgi:hypothetical protein